MRASPHPTRRFRVSTAQLSRFLLSLFLFFQRPSFSRSLCPFGSRKFTRSLFLTRAALTCVSFPTSRRHRRQPRAAGAKTPGFRAERPNKQMTKKERGDGAEGNDARPSYARPGPRTSLCDWSSPVRHLEHFCPTMIEPADAVPPVRDSISTTPRTAALVSDHWREASLSRFRRRRETHVSLACVRSASRKSSRVRPTMHDRRRPTIVRAARRVDPRCTARRHSTGRSRSSPRPPRRRHARQKHVSDDVACFTSTTVEGRVLPPPRRMAARPAPSAGLARSDVAGARPPPRAPRRALPPPARVPSRPARSGARHVRRVPARAPPAPRRVGAPRARVVERARIRERGGRQRIDRAGCGRRRRRRRRRGSPCAGPTRAARSSTGALGRASRRRGVLSRAAVDFTGVGPETNGQTETMRTRSRSTRTPCGRERRSRRGFRPSARSRGPGTSPRRRVV